jgi:hypothetical protein
MRYGLYTEGASCSLLYPLFFRFLFLKSEGGDGYHREAPDNVDIDEIMYRLYVLDKIRKGWEAV